MNITLRRYYEKSCLIWEFRKAKFAISSDGYFAGNSERNSKWIVNLYTGVKVQ